LSTGHPDTVATTGVFRIEPGAVNSVPCRAWLEIDLRDTQQSSRDERSSELRTEFPKFANAAVSSADWSVLTRMILPFAMQA